MPTEDPDLNRLVIDLARAHRGAATALLAEIGLHPGQELLILALTGQEPTTITHLAEALGVEVPTITKMVGRMEAGGLVSRGRDPDDGRVVRVGLTAGGAALEGELRERWERLAAMTVTGMDAEEQARLRDLLQRAAANLRSSGSEDGRGC